MILLIKRHTKKSQVILWNYIDKSYLSIISQYKKWEEQIVQSPHEENIKNPLDGILDLNGLNINIFWVRNLNISQV